MIRTFILIVVGVALIAWGASSFAELGSSTSRDGIVTEFAEGALDAIEDLTDGNAEPPDEPIVAMRITGTDGSGVATRSDCDDAARTGEVLPEGATVLAISSGQGRCAEWTLVEHTATSAEPELTWVRDAYLELAPDAAVDE